MGLFWKRKSGDQFVSLKLNEPLPEKTGTRAVETAETNGSDSVQPLAKAETESSIPRPTSNATIVEPVSTGAGPTPIPAEASAPAIERRPQVQTREVDALRTKVQQAKPVASRSPFATSVLGLNLSMEELQAQEAALEQEFSARFRRAVSATRESLSERLDTVFQGLKQIDENLLDELEEA